MVQAQETFAGVQFAGGENHPAFFDTRTGELWTYSDGKLVFKYRLTKLGEPLVKENRDRRKPRGFAPPTPPDMRVRIRRFGGLSYSRTVNLGIPSESK